MLFNYTYISHEVEKLQEYLDFLFEEVWLPAEGDFDAEKLSYNWKPADPTTDELQAEVYKAIQLGVDDGASRRAIFEQVWILAHNASNQLAPTLPPEPVRSPIIPTMSEPWYCCAEPNDEQVAGM